MNKPAAATAAQPRSRIAAWSDHHAQSLVASLGRMLRRPWATLLTVGVMAVALALPAGLWLALDNVARLAGTVEQAREITVFLKPEISLEQARSLGETLRGRADVARVVWRTPDEGLAQMRAAAGDDAQAAFYDEAVAALDANPLPSVLVVTPRGDELALAEALRALPEADQVQHDADWRRRLEGWLRFGERLAAVLAVLLGLGAVLVVGNTVRLDIQSRREEIAVLQSLGATDGFIRRPFLYLGAWYGLTAGALALGLLTATALALRTPLRALADSYGSPFGLSGATPLQALIVIAVATGLGWLGAGVVTGHFLRQTRA